MDPETLACVLTTDHMTMMNTQGTNRHFPEAIWVSFRRIRFTRGPWLELFSGAVLYITMVMVATYPAIKYWNTQMIGGSWDSGQNLWNFWWLEKAVQQGNFLPYYTNMLYYPRGVSLAYHTLSLFNDYEALILRWLLRISFPAAYNTVAVIAFVNSALAAYWLVKSLTRSSLSAFVSGIIFAFAPVHLSRLHFGHLGTFTSVQFVPLVALCIIRAGETRKWRYFIAAAILIAMVGWQSLLETLGTGLLANLLLLLFGQPRRNSRQLLFRWLGMMFLCGALMLPVAYPLLRDFNAFRDQANQTTSSIAASPDLLNFFVPDRSISTLWRTVLGRLTSQPLTDFFQIKAQHTVFLGFGVLALAACSAVVVPLKTAWRWWIIGATFFLLALGPALHIGGTIVFAPTPYTILASLPILGLGREPARYAIFLVLALSVVIGYFVAAVVRQWLPYRLLPQRLLVLGCCALVYMEFAAIPVKLDDRLANVPAYYREIARTNAPISGSILDVPYDLFGAVGPACDYMVYQIVHQRPIVSGYISRTPTYAANMLDQYPFIRQLRARIYGDAAPVLFTSQMIARGKDELRAIQVEYVILHKFDLTSDDAKTMENAISSAVSPPNYEDDAVIVWRVS